MFRLILTILTATTFVAHGLFGCCWHHEHGHADAVSRLGITKAAAECHEHHCHSHQEVCGASGEEGHSGSHHSHSPHDRQCDEDQCVFARTQDGPQLSGHLLMAAAVFLDVALPGDSLQMPIADRSAITAQKCSESLSAPACALSQLWLI